MAGRISLAAFPEPFTFSHHFCNARQQLGISPVMGG